MHKIVVTHQFKHVFSVLFETVLFTYVLVEKYIQSQTNTLILGIEAVGGEGGCSSL